MSPLFAVVLLTLATGPGLFAQDTASDTSTLPVMEQPPIHFDSLPALHSHIPFDSTMIPKEGVVSMIMASPSQFHHLVSIMVDSVVYDLGVTKDGEVRYISTADEAFATPEGLTVQSSLNDCRQFSERSGGPFPGWGYLLRLESGWCAAWCVGYTCGEQAPDDTTAIGWFYKGGS